MKKQLLKKLRLRAVMLVALLCAGFSMAWGETSSIEINTANSGVTGSYQDKEFDVNDITFKFNQWMKNNNIQAKKSTTNSCYNIDAIPGTITSIVVVQTGTARGIKIYGGTSERPTEQITSPSTALTMTFDFTGKNYNYFSLTTPGNACYFDKITINYTPSSSSTPSITAADLTLEYNDNSGSINYSVANPVEGSTLTATTTAEWLTIGNVGENTIPFTCSTNETATTREATVVLTYTYDSKTVTKNITVSQSAKDFATLPFYWNGGNKSGLTALTGVAANGLGSDYATSHAPYNVKFDGTGDYIQVKTDGQPGKVTIGVKKIGGAGISSITVQGSVDGETFTEVQSLKINGLQNDIVTLETTNNFESNVRYVRLYFNQVTNGNVGVGPITISKYGSVEAPIFSPLGGTFYSNQSVTLTCTTAGATIKYSYDNSTWNTYTEALTISETTTIYAKAVLGNAESDVVSATYTIAEKNDVVLNITNKELPYGETYPITRGSGNDVETDGYITVRTSNSNIASVNGLKITAEAVGTATITLSVTEGNTYKAGEGTFTVTVTAPEGLTTAVESVGSTAVLDFTKEPEENTNEWGLPVTSTNKETGSHTYNNGTYTITLYAPENEGYYWKPGESNGGQYLLMGAEGASLTLPAFDKAVTQIDVEGTDVASGKVTQNIFVGETAVSEETTGANKTNSYSIAENHQAAGTIYTLKVTNKYNTQIKTITVHFADGVAPTIPVTLNSSGYATFCSQYPLDFTNATDYSAWIVTGVNGSDITFVQVTGSVKGGTGILLKGTPSSTINLPSVDSETVPSGNLLEGTLAPTYIVDDTYYGLVGNEFLLIESAEGDPDTDRIAPAGKAILPASVVNGNVKTLNFVFNDETGIREVRTISAEEAAEIFNLAGQRLQKPQRGVNIVNGKKVLVK